MTLRVTTAQRSRILSKNGFINKKYFYIKNQMDYHSMSLVELKQVAKNHTPKIKQYYIKSRAELIQILSNEFTPDMIIAKKTIAELRKEAQERNLPGIWKMKRSDLVELLYPSSKQDNKNYNGRKEHYNPQKSESDEVGINMLKHSV